ncbi:hypothetical protein [Streptomyces tagetis]|uniref:Uncharacterized protein n=1 Tax=Streptomyces tagetis TaxID=2820809 RepID=A0A940XD46_9ACTN|nr:hypothetical protein [Streptomyces sp. RG38]MBQ0825002.1 hypothetical protein [Streptomyces sp. RG38]
MREKPDNDDEADIRAEGESRRIELSVPQVAGSALAAVLAAKLASSFGVYGTILGAGVISVVATCGGPVFQHFFRSTGERLRAGRPVTAAGPAAVTGRVPGPAATATTAVNAPPAPGEYTEGTVYRARARNRKRPLVAAAIVFGVTMGGVTAYELASGESLSGGPDTTVGSALSGKNRPSPDRREPGGSDESPSPGDSATPGSSQAPGTSGDPEPTPSATPGTTAPDGTTPGGGTETGPAPAPDASTGPADPGGTGPTSPAPTPTAPAPSASGRSGTGDQGPDGPAAP